MQLRADENLAACGQIRDPRCHRHIPAEQIVAPSHRRTDMRTDPHADAVIPVAILQQRLLYRDAAAHRIVGHGEAIMKPSPWFFTT